MCWCCQCLCLYLVFSIHLMNIFDIVPHSKKMFNSSDTSRREYRLVCVRMCASSNVVDLSAVSAGGGGVGVQCSNAAADTAAAVAAPTPSQVSHDYTTATTPVYEHCGPASAPASSSSTSSSPPLRPAPAAERPVPRPRSTYGKYYLENLKNINAESKAAGISSPDDSSDAAWWFLSLVDEQLSWSVHSTKYKARYCHHV